MKIASTCNPGETGPNVRGEDLPSHRPRSSVSATRTGAILTSQGSLTPALARDRRAKTRPLGTTVPLRPSSPVQVDREAEEQRRVEAYSTYGSCRYPLQ